MKFLVAALLCLTSQVSPASPRTDLASVRPSEGVKYVGRSMWLLEDSTATMTAEQAFKHPAARPADQPVPNLGISPSVFWAWFDITNDAPEDHVFVEFDHAEVGTIDLYLVKDGEPVLFASTGQGEPIGSRDLAIHEFVFDVPVKSGFTTTVMFRLASTKQLQVPVNVYTPSGFTRERSERNLNIGGYIGIMLALALYNLFVFLSIRDRTYIIYVLYILLVMLTQLAFWGVGQFYLWPDHTWFSVKASIIFTFATAVAASEFMKRFLDTPRNAPELHRWTKYFYGLFGLVMLLFLFIDPYLGYRAAQVAAGLFASFLYITAWKVWRMGSRQGGYFLVAWSMFLLGTMVYSLKDMGILPYNTVTVFSMPIGSALEGILLSFALADRINILRREKEQSQAEALAISQENERIIREQNTLLELKVKERTHALEESNAHLKQTQAKLVSAEKMASLGQLTAGIAHEINNPVNFITSNILPLKRNISEILGTLEKYRSINGPDAATQLQEVRRHEEELGIQESIDELDGIIASISEGSHRTAEIVRGLRNFSRLDEDDLKNADLNEGLRSTLAVLSPQYRGRVDIRLDLGELPPVECYPGRVNQVFMNIITNAMQAVLATDKAVKEVRISTRATEAGQVLVSIADNGVGMSAKVKEHIYDPFFTTKPVGEGTGLGMAIVYGIVEDHHGRIHVESTEGEGSTFTLELPVRQPRTNQQRA